MDQGNTMNTNKAENIQVDPQHYYNDYDHKKRWISYWHQIQEVLKFNPDSVLEVGVGNKTVSNYLENRGIDVTTTDIDPELEPDVVCDVRNLSDKFDGNSFDVVLCAEVLEHIPFEDFRGALDEIRRVTKGGVVLTLPNWGIPFDLRLKIPKTSLSITLRLPFPVNHKFNGEHH